MNAQAHHMNASRRMAIDMHLGRTDWHDYRGNGCVGVVCGRVSYYFFFDAADQITRVIID